nr:hypothetical protein [uncultured Mucilaginibacter sp.]
MTKKILYALIAFATTTANAQKLPNVQKESVRAPANLKIDGKATEWDNKFKAQNSATELFYTISNDDENLYLTIQTKLRDIAGKIMRGGISLNINPTLSKKSDGQISVTYPSLDQQGMSRLTNMILLTDQRNLEHNPGAQQVTADDLNKELGSKAKVIGLSGIKTINTAEIPIYNENGILVAARFDENFAYTYELAIPLKYLSLPDNGTNPFSYQVKVNEPKKLTPKFDGNGPPPPPPPPMGRAVASTTDFWGEYTLAKK